MHPVDFLSRRFGFSAEWLRDLKIQEDQGTIFVGTPEVMKFREAKPLRRGIRLCRIFPASIKPTTFAMQIFGRLATRSRIEVSEEQARVLINGGEIEVGATIENGYVIVFWREFVVGVGLYKKPILKSCIPMFRPLD